MKSFGGAGLIVPVASEFKWSDRTRVKPMARFYLVSLLAIITVYLISWMVFGLLVSVLLLLFLMLRRRIDVESRALTESEYVEIVPPTATYQIIQGELECSTHSGRRYLTSLSLESAGSDLIGNLSSLVRALNMAYGVRIIVEMTAVPMEEILDTERIDSHMDTYLGGLSSGLRNAYSIRRSGFWAVRVSILGRVENSNESKFFESAVLGAIPERHWATLEADTLEEQLSSFSLTHGEESFHASGEELSEWLIQLASELASEVGSNVPGEFLAPIRPGKTDYELGRILNPETMQLGHSIGLMHDDIGSGLLLCGGSTLGRLKVIRLLVVQLLNAGNRVTILTNNSGGPELAALHDDSIFLELGKDLVINPVDPDDMRHDVYVSSLISALVPLAGRDLRNAGDLEVSLLRAVSMSNSTIADIKLEPNTDMNSVQSDIDSSASPTTESVYGYHAIRQLYLGLGARAFYGNQTLPMSSITSPPLCVISLQLGSEKLEQFAWDLLCIKIAGLEKDENHVVILHDAENLRTRPRSHLKQNRWTEEILEGLLQRSPVIVSLEHPADLSPGTLGKMLTCLSLRLRDSSDIKVAVDLLGLSIIATGMHSKARHSSRETSYIRTMDDETVLLANNKFDSCIPIHLGKESPDFAVNMNDLKTRSERFLPNNETRTPAYETSILRQVAGSDEGVARALLELLERYEPLTEEAMRRYLSSSGDFKDPDIASLVSKLERSNMILKGHETHSNVSYKNYRITMKGSMALRQSREVSN